LVNFPTDTLASGWRLAVGAWRAITLDGRMNAAMEASSEFRTHDYGARLSVRELVAEPVPTKYLQLLDDWKYTKLLERVVLEAVASFLAENGLDASDFDRHITQVQNVFGDVNNILNASIHGGQQSFGGSNINFEQRN
jgi:hypothetical protein